LCLPGILIVILNDKTKCSQEIIFFEITFGAGGKDAIHTWTDDGRRTTEGGGRKSEGRGQKTEEGWRRRDGGGGMADDRLPRLVE